MTLMRKMIMATTSRRWMNHPIVYTPITPRSQRTMRITAIVMSIIFLLIANATTGRSAEPMFMLNDGFKVG